MSTICEKKKNDETRKFFCQLCGGRYARCYDVGDDFVRCVELNGNPAGLCWDDHPSCKGFDSKRNKKKPKTKGSSHVNRASGDTTGGPGSTVVTSKKRKRNQ